jgi:glycosyltransferase involved in cell wall biosynthesis
MKILLAANTAWYLYNFRAALIDEIKQRGWEPVLVSPPDRYVDEFTKAGYRHISWELGRQTIAPWTELQSIRDLREIYEREQPALVHHHTMKAVIYGSLAAIRSGVSVVNSIPGRGYVFSSTSLKARLLKPVVTSLLRYAFRKELKQEMIFENRDDLKFFLAKRLIPESKTILIPSVGVDRKRFHPAPLPDGVFTVGFVGRMLRDKGVVVFVEAAQLLQEWGVPCRMVLIGGPDPGNAASVTVEELKEWDQFANVEWWGWVEDMQQAYAQIHALAQPTSYGEGVPTTLVEAAAVNRAIIASDWPGCREIITDNETGLLVPPKDPLALAQAIRRMAENTADYERLRKNVHELVLVKFSADDVNSQTLAVYDNILSAGAADQVSA